MPPKMTREAMPMTSQQRRQKKGVGWLLLSLWGPRAKPILSDVRRHAAAHIFLQS